MSFILRKEIKYIKINSLHNPINDSFFKNNSLKNQREANSYMINYNINKNTKYNSNKRIFLNDNNNRKKAGVNNGFEIYNNSIGNNSNINSLPNNKPNNLLYSGFTSSVFDHSNTYRNNQKNVFNKNNCKKESFNSFLNYINSQSWSESICYQSPQILQDLKKTENKKPNNLHKINFNNNIIYVKSFLSINIKNKTIENIFYLSNPIM